MPGSTSPTLVGAIDEGTSSARFLVFSSATRRIVASHQVTISQQYPKEGWVEQDPMEILNAVTECLEKTALSLHDKGVSLAELAAIGITNQRETTIVWDPVTGEPLHNAIVWLDIRTTATIDKLMESIPNKDINHLKPACGLPLSPYFSALKLRWLLDNVPSIKEAVQNKRCLFGNVDAWIIWNLTGGKNGGLHITDVTNASRTMLMNLATLKWDPNLCNFFDIPMDILPEIRSSSEIYAKIQFGGAMDGIYLSGCLGDQQSALFGQMCLKKGQAKSTYGTGCFLLYNTGNDRVASKHGLLTTVGYQLGSEKAVYALEGSVAVAGAAFKWLKDNIGLVDSIQDVENLANRVHHSGDIYFVPAFSGLYAPYWQSDARGVICGITEETQRAHIMRAALEAICFQTRDILEAMHKDCGIPLTKLQVDGGMIANNLLMQLQADLCGIPVVRPHMAETTALGAAMAAGAAKGIDVWDMSNLQPNPSDVFQPKITDFDRNSRYSKWKMAVERSFGWEI